MTHFLIGGTGFIGRVVTQRLIDAGHTVTVFHRGQTTPDLPEAVTTIHGDREDPEALRDALDAVAPDVVLDVIPHTEVQAEALVDVCTGRTDRLVALSSGDVYRQYDGLRRVAHMAGIDTTIRIGPDGENSFPFNWEYSMALDTRRIRTELKFAEPISHQQTLVRSVLWEREHEA